MPQADESSLRSRRTVPVRLSGSRCGGAERSQDVLLANVQVGENADRSSSERPHVTSQAQGTYVSAPF